VNDPTSSACQSHTGLVREHNEDSCFHDSELGLWVVADGMGGHLAGECASQIAVKTIVDSIRQKKVLTAAVEAAHDAAMLASSENPEMTGMGSTVVAAHLNGNMLEVAWVGDSRQGNRIKITSVSLRFPANSMSSYPRAASLPQAAFTFSPNASIGDPFELWIPDKNLGNDKQL